MNDRELLELAAKAVGKIPKRYEGNPHYMDGVLDFWNPLIDDGDALVLAVSLRIEVAPESFSRSRVDVRERWGTYLWEMYSDHGDDAQKATRYAIVRAAAEIGRKMK